MQAQYRIVTNHAGRFSIWPSDKVVPDGWRSLEHTGDREHCLREVDQRWKFGKIFTDSQWMPPVETLTGLLRESVATHGDRPAVTDGKTRLTYTQLDDLSDRLAAELRAIGVTTGEHVAMYLQRGVQVFVSMLGILKAGAAYVPVDTRYPDARRDLMITAGEASVVITDQARGAALSHLDTRVLTVDLADLEGRPGNPEAAGEISAAGAAAVLFTSGSSGRPKPVVLEHRNLVHFARNPALPPLASTDRVGHVSSLSFDAFHFETWCAFGSGAEIVVLPTMPDLINADVQRELKRNRITVMLVPTMAVNHVVHEDRDAFSTLRLLFTGGDVIAPAACRELLGSAFSGEFVNLYGPTEATTAVTMHVVTPEDAETGNIPIGIPLAGCDLKILDDRLDEVGPGEVGVLHIGGAGVSRGYFAQPGLTASEFLPDAGNPDGLPMYRTGDLVRRRADGLLEYVGRSDDQVKIRGYRVEPREVERAIQVHQDVRNVAVIAVGEGDGKHLIALLSTYGTATIKQLRDFAVETLPDYMVPGSFVFVPDLPADAHGKRDLDRLRHLAEQELERARTWVAPRDDVERQIVTIWEDMLPVEKVGVADEFFMLGGNSLLAFRVQRRITKEMGVTLGPEEVLANSSLEALASLVRTRKETTGP